MIRQKSVRPKQTSGAELFSGFLLFSGIFRRTKNPRSFIYIRSVDAVLNLFQAGHGGSSSGSTSDYGRRGPGFDSRCR